MKKARKLDLSSTSTFTVRIEGVPVTVSVDANGWPCTITENSRHTDEHTVRLAMRYAQERAEHAALATAKARSDFKRTRKSTKTIQTRAADHFSALWFAAVLAQRPKLGALQLARTARELLAKDLGHPDNKRRKEISEWRARQYLLAIKKPRET